MEGRLPLKQSSDRRETLRKRVSDDPRQFNFWRTTDFVDEFFDLGRHFLRSLASFGGFGGLRASKSTSSQFFALDAPILGSVRPNIDEKMSVSKFRRQKLLACGVVYPRHVSFLFLRCAGHYS